MLIGLSAARLSRAALSILPLAVLPLACLSSASEPAADRATSTDGALGRLADEPLDPDAQARAAEWRRQVLYLVVPDRFYNGNEENDLAGDEACFRPEDPFGFHGGDLEGLRQKASYLEELGVTAVWSTPLYRQVAEATGRCGYHGYWADFVIPDDGALEPKLGTSDEFDALLAELHDRDIDFVMDMVVNHSGDLARIAQQRPDWFHPEEGCEELGPEPIYCPLDHHPDFAHELPEVADYLDDQARGWLSRHAIDGIRVDTVKHVEPSYFADRFIPAVREQDDGLFLVAEVFDEGDPVRAQGAYLEAGFDSAFQFGLRRAFVDSFAMAGSVDAVADRLAQAKAGFGVERMLMMTNLLDNHDVPRFANLPGPSVAPEEIVRRHHLGLAALLTVPGIPQLYYGDEIGMYGGGDPDNRRDMPAWAFDAQQRRLDHGHDALPDAHKTFDFTKKLISLRRSLPALHSGDYTELWRHNGGNRQNLLAFLRHTNDGVAGGQALVVINNDTRFSNVRVPLCANPALDEAACGADGQVWDDVLGDAAPLVQSGGKVFVRVPAKSAAVYVPRASKDAAVVHFEVRTRTSWGDRIILDGTNPELRLQQLELRAEDCDGDICTWRGTVKYIPHGTRFTWEVTRLSPSTGPRLIGLHQFVEIGTEDERTVRLQ